MDHNPECAHARGKTCHCSQCHGALHSMGVSAIARKARRSAVSVHYVDGHGHAVTVHPNPDAKPNIPRSKRTRSERILTRAEHVHVEEQKPTPPPPPPPPPPPLASLTDEQLADEVSIALENGDDARFAELEREMNARDAIPGDAWLTGGTDTGTAEHWGREDTDADRQIDDLLARGYDYVDAYTEVHGGDADRMRREQASGLVDRSAGQSTEQAIRRDYDQLVHLQWLQAETELRGHLLTAQAEHSGITALELFSGPLSRARKWASEDLQRWWADHPRLTYAEFRAQVLGDNAAATAREMRVRSNGRDFL